VLYVSRHSFISGRCCSWASVTALSNSPKMESMSKTRRVASSLMNSLGGSIVTSSLLLSPLSSTKGLDRKSAAVWVFPGTCLILNQ